VLCLPLRRPLRREATICLTWIFNCINLRGGETAKEGLSHGQGHGHHHGRHGQQGAKG
jgi:hypothetical protein